jgi:hypothetical protein
LAAHLRFHFSSTNSNDNLVGRYTISVEMSRFDLSCPLLMSPISAFDEHMKILVDLCAFNETNKKILCPIALKVALPEIA